MAKKRGKQPRREPCLVGAVIVHHFGFTAYKSHGWLALAADVSEGQLSKLLSGDRCEKRLTEKIGNICLALALGKVQAGNCPPRDMTAETGRILLEVQVAFAKQLDLEAKVEQFIYEAEARLEVREIQNAHDKHAYQERRDDAKRRETKQDEEEDAEGEKGAD